MIRFARDNPSPQPLFLVEYPGLKTVFNLLDGIPFPVSEMSIIIKEYNI